MDPFHSSGFSEAEVMITRFSEKKVQKLSPFQNVFLLDTNMYSLGIKVHHLKRYSPSDCFCTFFFWKCIVVQIKYNKLFLHSHLLE